MEELKKQIDILIDRAEYNKTTYMVRGQHSELKECDGQIQAYKLIKLLINTNLKLSNMTEESDLLYHCTK